MKVAPQTTGGVAWLEEGLHCRVDRAAHSLFLLPADPDAALSASSSALSACKAAPVKHFPLEALPWPWFVSLHSNETLTKTMPLTRDLQCTHLDRGGDDENPRALMAL